jgi:peptidoglycan/xylan/chitin deacetylase (PgdA/CDA1 family)
MPLAEGEFPGGRNWPVTTRRVAFLSIILTAAVLAAACWPAAGAQAAPARATLPAATQATSTSPKTIVTFAWGGGLADQMPSLPMFRKYGMHATYFVASGLVCTLSQAECRESSPYLTLGDVHKIAAYGNEIGGLSVTHQQLTTMPDVEVKREICDDRSTLFQWGLRPTNFAYPFAQVNPTLEAITRACGYNSGLGTGTLRGADRCNTCAWAETVPPKNPYNVRTPVEVNSVNTHWIPRTYESIVADAQKHGGGWIIFTLHDICKTDCNLGTDQAILGAVLKWLHGQEKNNIAVETMNQVIGGPVRPPVAGPAPSALPSPGVANASLAEVNGRMPACFQPVHYGGTVASFSYQPGSGPHGSASETIRVRKPAAGNALLVQGMDLGLCAPTVSSRRAYTTGMWYKSSSQVRIVTYVRSWLGSWTYWKTSPAFPASGSWRQASWNTPVVPVGITAISFGLAAHSGTVSTADYSLKIAKSYKELILLGLLAFVLVAAGLITRGHYRYTRYLKAEAAAAEAQAARDTARSARAAQEAAGAKAEPVGVKTEPVRAKARRDREKTEPVGSKTEPVRAKAERPKASPEPPKAKPEPSKTKTEPAKAKPEPAKVEDATVIDATVIMQAVDPAGTGRATSD